MRRIFFFSTVLAIIFVYMPHLGMATSQSVDLRIQILPAGGDEEPEEATTTLNVPASTSVGGATDSDSVIERAHNMLIDTVTDLINQVVIPDAGTLRSEPGEGAPSSSRDLALAWDADDASAVRMLIVIASGAAQNIDEVLITHLSFDPLQVRGVIDGDIYDISIFGRNGVELRDFSENPISITMHIPERLQGQNPLGMFYFDEGESIWTRVRGASFSDRSVIFTTDHLSVFGIFALTQDMIYTQNLVSKDTGMLHMPAKSVAGVVPGQAVRVWAEMIVIVLYASVAAIIAILIRFSVRFVPKKT